MLGLPGTESVSVPDGWSRESFFSRLVAKGLCSYEYLSSPETPVKSVFGMLRMLDFEMFLELKAIEREQEARKSHGCR